MKTKNILFFFFAMLISSIMLTFLNIPFEIYSIKSYLIILVIAFIILNIINLFYINITELLKAKNISLSFTKQNKNLNKIENNNAPTHSKRQTGLDIVRFIAVFSVPLIHFFGLSGYYSTNLEESKIFYFTMLRFFAVCAVPLFLMITGYFKINKTLSKAHYKAIIPVLLSHILITSIRLIVDYKYHQFDVNLEYILDKLLYFEYGWYVKLYIGMLLLMPFLNLCYHNLVTKKRKEYFILTLIFMTSLGPLCFDIIPQSWLILYVFMYYFIGGYLKEYKPKINKPTILIALIFMLYIISKASFIHSDGGVFDWDYLAYSTNSGYSAFPVVIITTLIFMLFKDINLKGKILPEIFRTVSVVSLEMYLFSQMFDGIIYTPFQNINMDFYFYADKIYIIVPTIFCLSYIAAKAKQLVFYLISATFKGIKKICFKAEVTDISFKAPVKLDDMENIKDNKINASIEKYTFKAEDNKDKKEIEKNQTLSLNTAKPKTEEKKKNDNSALNRENLNKATKENNITTKANQKKKSRKKKKRKK